MASRIRHQVAEKLVGIIHKVHGNHVDPEMLAHCVRIPRSSKQSHQGVLFRINHGDLIKAGVSPSTSAADSAKWITQVINQDAGVGLIQGNKDIQTYCNHLEFTKAILQDITEHKSNYGRESALYNYLYDKTTSSLQCRKQHETVVIDYSSPNVAKPFHAGHIRSTLIGNFLSNLNEFLGHNVIRINYLGDWGTQFGLLGVGMQKYSESQTLSTDPNIRMTQLAQIYVDINQEIATLQKTATSEMRLNEIYREGLEYFKLLENGESNAVAMWQELRQFSINEYKKMYDRLHVKFDEYHGESMYAQKALEVIQRLKFQGHLRVDSATGVSYVDVGTEQHSTHADLLKSDGTTLYLTRDLAAALDRYERYKFDRLHYVVNLAQHSHFKNLHSILKKMDNPWANSCTLNDIHITFGTVKNMSSRQGGVLLLETILEECYQQSYQRMIAQQQEKSAASTISDPSELQFIAEELAMSCIVCLEMQTPRNKSYDYMTTNWAAMLNSRHKGGYCLQYTHSRIVSLEERFTVPEVSAVDLSLLTEPEAQQLIVTLGSMDEAVVRSFNTHEALYVYSYLIDLCKHFNSAYKVLRIQDAKTDTANARMLLFHCTRIVLANGLRLLGLVPLDKT